MAGKRYSAGTIFLQVVPVFNNVQRAIEDEANDIDRALGDRMEKSGEKAGERAGKAAARRLRDEIRQADVATEMEREFRRSVDGMNKALGEINTKNLGKRLRNEVKGMRSELDSLGGIDLKIDDNFEQAATRVAALRRQIEDMRKRSNVFFDIKGLPEFYRKLKQAETAIDRMDATVDLKVDTKSAVREMSSFEKAFKRTVSRAASHLSGAVGKEAERLRDELKYLENLRIGVDVSANQARAELKEIFAELQRLERSDPEIDARWNGGKAAAEIALFEASLDRLDGRDIDVDVDVDTRRARMNANDAANTFRSFNAVILAATTIGPALVPVLGAIAGGLLAIGPAAAVAGAGLGSVLVGFSGLGDALEALQNRQDQAATTAQTYAKQQRAAAYAVEDAQQSLADAERNAAQASTDAARRVADARQRAAETIENAIERQRDAQEQYRDSINEVREAERALREARREAAEDGEDLQRQIRDNQLAIDQALIDSFNAQVEYNAAQADGGSTNLEREQTRINMERARLTLEELRAEQEDLAQEKRKWDREGVDGTERVKTAEERVNDALAAQRDAYENVRDAAAEVDRARREGAEMVTQAIEAQNQTLANNARAIERARESLRRAREAQEDVNTSINAQQQAVDNAMNALGPAGRRFARFLFGLKSGFRDFRNDVQAAMLPTIEDAIVGFLGSDNASVARKALVDLAESFGRFTKSLSGSLQGEAWGAFFGMLAEYGPTIQEAYGDAFISFMEAMASIMTTLAPYAQMFADGLASMMDSFANWAASQEGQDALRNFMDYVVEIAPDVLEFLGAFARAFISVAEALAPWGEILMVVLTGLFDAIDRMDPRTLGLIMTASIVMLAASQIAYGLMSLFMAWGALSALAIGPWVFGIIMVAAAIAALWVKSEGFRDFMIDAWDRISAAISKAYEDFIEPALGRLMDALGRLWDEVLAPFFAWLGPKLVWMAENLLPLFAFRWGQTIDAITFLINYILIPVLKAVGWFFNWLWENVIDPIASEIGESWDELMSGMAWAWDNVLKPMFDLIEGALDDLEGAFDKAVAAISDAWDDLKRAVGAPIRFVLESIINGGLIDGLNEVASWVGLSGFDPIDIPRSIRSYATGGVMPGYTPGRDVHAFYSPTAGRLELSGGEAVMRPEWTAAMGPGYVDYMNRLARSGGVNAVKQAIYGKGGYWMGGVLPLPGGSVAVHRPGQYPGFAADLNYPGYADYGKAIKAWKKGIVAQMNFIGDRSYGRWVVLNHPGGQNSLYAHLSSFGDIAVGDTVRPGQTIGYVGDIGNTGTPPTSHLHMEINGGAVDYSQISSGDAGRSIPAKMASLVADPLGAVKGWITDKWASATDFADTPVFDMVKRTPLLLAEKVTDKVWDIVPGWAKTAAGWAGDAAEWVVGGVDNALGAAADAARGAAGAVKGGIEAVGDFLGLANGGILPYNGTMMYDDGGYLPPGLTTVLNLTGKPEPVFTDDQWSDVSSGGGPGIHYEPHFYDSDLTAEDVADDLDFAFRRISRGGKYAGSR